MGGDASSAEAVRDLIKTAHRHDVSVSTGGFIEYVLTQGVYAVDEYIKECKEIGFDIIEVWSGFITISIDDWLRVVEKVQVMFEAADPEVFTWYMKNYGPGVNLFIDHSQIVHLECLRSGIWGTKSVWGRIVTHRG